MKRTTADMNNDEFLDYLIREKSKIDLFWCGLAISAAGIFAYALNLSIAASLIAGAVGMIAILVSGYMHLTQPEFVSTVPVPDPDYDYEADREEREYWTRIWEEEDRAEKTKSKK